MLAAGLLVIACLGGCATPSTPSDPLAALLDLIELRLAVSEDVARSKWNSGAPIEDLARERAIVDSIGTQAAAHRLEAAFAKAFFQAQIEASKVVQQARLTQWRASNRPPFADAPDLQRDIRPQLDRITPAMLDALARALPALHAQGIHQRLSVRASDAAHRAALAPLIEWAPRN